MRKNEYPGFARRNPVFLSFVDRFRGLNFTLFGLLLLWMSNGVPLCAGPESDSPEKNRQLEIARRDAKGKGIKFSADFTVLEGYSSELQGPYTIPGCVTVIGESAFAGCSKLTGVTIPDGVVRIESYAFGGCSKLTDVTIPKSVTAIGQGAFLGCPCADRIKQDHGHLFIDKSAQIFEMKNRESTKEERIPRPLD